MKSYTSLLFYLSLIFMSMNLSSCDEMDDIQKKYADEEEIIYLGKIDSVKVISGFGRVKLTWQVSADPRIERIRINWKNNAESVVKDFNRSVSGVVKDSIIIEDLSEGNYTFELISESDQYTASLPTLASGSVWGSNRGDDLGSRSINSFDLDHINSTYTLKLSPVQKINAEDSMVYSEITYMNTSGSTSIAKVLPDTTKVILEDFAPGNEFTLRDAFVSSTVIDTVFNNYRTFDSPSVITESGVNLGEKGDLSSDYFAISDSVIYEWNQESNLISYSVFPNSIEENDAIEYSDFPRDSFNVIFYNGGGQIIAVSHAGEVLMHKLVNDTITQVLTPGGEEVLGSGFTNFNHFIRGNGFFYTVTNESGELKTWYALDDATWGSPNGATVATGFEKYELLTWFNSNLLAIDQEGYLWRITLKANGEPNIYRKIGSGWDRFTSIMGMGTRLLCLNHTGDFYLFDDINTENEFLVVE